MALRSRRPDPVGLDTTQTMVTIGKKAGKPPGKQRVRLNAVAAPGLAPKDVLTPASAEDTKVFHPSHLLGKISFGISSRGYQAGESVYSQGDLADAVFYLESGGVKLTVVSTSGKEAVVAVLPETSFFGEGCLAGQPLRVCTVTAIQQSTVTRVAKSAMNRLLHEEPEFAERFLTHLLTRNIRMQSDLVDHLFNSSEKRLARLLLLMANFGHESKPIPLVAKMSQETLAEMIGTTRSRVSFFMNRFRDLGFIEYGEGGMHVHSSLVSVVLHD